MTDAWDETEGTDRAALATEPALELLIRELLLERTRKLEGATLVAFIDGWSSLLDLLGRVDLLLPSAPAELREALIELVSRIREVQQQALADDDLP
ncbi:hypothetical protein ACNOYE_11515 [Nannocystaceae bacterium ST9]